MGSIFVVEKLIHGAWEAAGLCVNRDDVSETEARRVVAYEPVPDWTLVSERMPRDGEEVEFVLRVTQVRSLGRYSAHSVECFAAPLCHAAKDDVLCWRPARPIGTLPEPKEKA